MITLNDILTVTDIDCPINLTMFRGVDYEYVRIKTGTYKDEIIKDIKNGVLNGNAQVIKLDAEYCLYIEMLAD